ncbi:MAG: uroporphyrinogen decarboxylase [Gammaproteobacteria bacterium]|nr:uroporphyrinogen decarboxylase [Gammaproteobacteria bacterium]
MTHSSRFLSALARQPVDCPPVWLMRQAGRYLPEYRATREQAGSFLQLCKTPELACEVTLQPLRRFDLDAAILFADILLIADAMGLGLQMVETQGPVITQPIRSAKDLANLPHIHPEHDLAYVYQTIRLLRKELPSHIPLIGFAGSPWTVAAYLVEGRGTKEFYALRGLMYGQPDLLHALLHYLTEVTVTYLSAQVKAGAQALMLFDTWGGLLNPVHYLAFSLEYVRQITHALKALYPSLPLILYSKNGAASLEARAGTGVDALGLDWTVDIGHARQRVGQRVALQGNLDPGVLYSSPETLRKEIRAILSSFGPYPGHIFNLGHGIPLDVPPDNIKILVDTVHEG